MVGAGHNLKVGAQHGQIKSGRNLADTAAIFFHGLSAHIRPGRAVAVSRRALAQRFVVGKCFPGIEHYAVAGFGCQGHIVLTV